MAVVLDALAPYVKKMITDMAEEELSMLLGVECEIKKLNDNVIYLQDYLTDAERRRITDKNVKAWVGKLKDVMYEATDILELCQLEAMEQPEKSYEVDGASSSRRPTSFGGKLKKKLQGCFRPLVFCLRNPVFAHETGSRIKKLNEDLDNIHKDAKSLNFINLGSYEERRKLIDPAHIKSKKMTAGFNTSEVVGENIERDTENLVQKLITQDGRDLKVLAIVGQGGMGKTLLAKKIFASEVIKDEFKTKIWLSVTQHFDKVELLRSAITHAGGKHHEEKDESILERTLIEALSANKFLLVLDDVWSDGPWKDILHVPAANASCTQPGSRVLVTSRMEDVVQRMGASSGDLLRVRKLDNDDSWSLLKKQLPEPEVIGESTFDHLKDIGMQIISKCDGLPLAIKVMGGLLSTRRPSKLEWENILKKIIAWKENGLHEELNSSVHLSYDDLSPELKQCFLYYSLFPKGSAPSDSTIISMWISEGFIQDYQRSESNQHDLEEIGTDYHQELVNRNLLELSSDHNMYHYCMHDVVCSFAQFMAREEALVVQKEQTDIKNLLLSTQRVRRLSITLEDSILEWRILENLESLRTLMLNCSIKPSGTLASFSGLRVLSIECAECDWILNSLCQLRHLRFLRLKGVDISRLPEDIHKMKLLEHIELLHCMSLNKLPESNELPNGLCGMLNLEEVQIIYAPSIEVVGPDFQSLASGDGGAVVTRPFPKLKQLVLGNLPRWKEWDWEEEQGKGMAMPALEELYIEHCKLSRLPEGLASRNRHNLRTLYLYGLSILQSVENFPSVVELDVLYCPELKKISGFSKLRKISIDGCPKLESLEGFPVLCSMVLDQEPWEITGTPVVVCTPKVYQVGVEPQLPENFTVTR